jgi:hypothetical protein
MQPETTILRIKHGSHLFGTNTPDSDLDYKEVYLPSGRDIILQRVTRARASAPSKAPGEKNSAGDVDTQSFSLQKFFSMIVEGDVIGLELLFAPPSHVTYEHEVFASIRDRREIFFSKNIRGYVGYCRSQAAKYGIRGSRVAALRGILDLLSKHLSQTRLRDVSQSRLRDVLPELTEFTQRTEHTSLVEVVNRENGVAMLHLEVCNRKSPMSNTVLETLKIYQKAFDEYGHRALAAERNEGVDWKAMSHAVRVGQQAIEFLNTGHITFPRPNAEILLRIKRGLVPYVEVAEELVDLLEMVEEAARRSTLPESADLRAVDELIVELYSRQIQ